jgi:arginyl-tRNA synthetase
LAYAEGHKAYEDSEESKKEILEINKKIYDESDPEISKIYEDGRQKSLESFEALYKRLDSNFDFHFFESESGEIGGELVRENIGKVFETGEGGAVIFKGENFEPKTHTRVFLNSEGLPTYEAKELGLAQIKKDWFDYDKSITVTANEQDSFFKVVEVAIGEVFPELKGKLKHLSHGMLKLPSGKMSSRTGTIISAEDLISQVKQKVEDKIKDRELNHTEIEEIGEMVAIGAIKYSILRQAIGGDIVFDFDKSISFEGDSGPYLQYATVRANSILKKAEGLVAVSKNVPENWQTQNIERTLERFSSIVEKSGFEYAPHYLVTYLTELAGEFNSFYAGHKIIDETDPTSPYRLYITKAFVQVMTTGLNLLGIKVPEKM